MKQWVPTKGLKYIAQRAPDANADEYLPVELDTLPPDIPSLAPGDWKYSSVLKSWVGYSLPDEQVRRFYLQRIGLATP